MGRLVLLLVVLAVGFWLYKNSAGGLLGDRGGDASSQAPAPADRARDAAARIESRQAETDRLAAEAQSPREAGRVHENMTRAEVRALLGPPDEVTSDTTESGAPRETWLYRSVGKKVVFENGVAVSVQ
jgi:hypothetical protein